MELTPISVSPYSHHVCAAPVPGFAFCKADNSGYAVHPAPGPAAGSPAAT